MISARKVHRVGPMNDFFHRVARRSAVVLGSGGASIVQNSQNGDAKATQLKLDELIRAQPSARNGLITLEGLDEAELAGLEAEFVRLRESARLSSPTLNSQPI